MKLVESGNESDVGVAQAVERNEMRAQAAIGRPDIPGYRCAHPGYSLLLRSFGLRLLTR